jgi:FkbM family methyltransferase
VFAHNLFPALLPALEPASFFSSFFPRLSLHSLGVAETILIVTFTRIVKRSFDRALPDFVLAPVLSQMARLQHKGVRRIFRDHDLWIHETNAGYFAYHEPYLTLDLKRLDEIARRNFLWGYTPAKGDVIIDVGAGVGEETLTFARAVGKSGKVICIEAHPKTYRCLQALVRYNRLENVITLHRAISQPGRSHELIEDSSEYLSNRLENSKGISVPATTVDAICDLLRVHRVNFLKMNIEGAERLAIRGMTETLKHTQALCICCHDFLAEQRRDDSCRTMAMVQDFLRQSGFKVVERCEPDAPAYINHQVWGYNPAVVAAVAS